MRRHPARWTAAAAGALLALLSLGGVVAAGVLGVGDAAAGAQVPPEVAPPLGPQPTPLPTPLPTPTPLPDLPVPLPDDEPTDEPSDDVSSSPTPTPAATATPDHGDPAPDQREPAPASDPSPAGVPDGIPVDARSGAVVVPGAGRPPDAPAPAPDVADPAAGGPTGAGTVQPMAAAGVSRLAAALPGTFGVAALGLILAAVAAPLTFALTDRGLLTARTPDGGTDVDRTRRWRTVAGLALLGAATLVGIIGYLRISLETLVPVQVVYLASAGFAVVLLAVTGGSLLVSEQLRSDERRLREIEESLAGLGDQLKVLIAQPPRLLDRGHGEDA